MNEKLKTRYSVDKLVLLGFLVIAVLAAQLIVRSRSSILLSEPVILRHSGVSVAIASGNGWENEMQWKYIDNSFSISSHYSPHPKLPTAWTRCRYLIAASKDSSDNIFENRALAVGGTIEETGQIQTESLTIEWAHIKKKKTPLDYFIGSAELPNNRRLEIETYLTTGDTILAEQVFKTIVENVKFQNNKLLEAGSEIVTEVKNIGLGRFITPTSSNRSQSADDRGQWTYMQITDTQNQPAGFLIESLLDSQTNTQFNIHAFAFTYLKNRHEKAAILKSDNSFDEYAVKSDIYKRGQTMLEVMRNRTMKITKSPVKGPEKIYHLSPAAIPEQFLESALIQLLDSEHKKIVIDIIKDSGAIIPTLISVMDVADIKKASEDADYALKLEPLGRASPPETIFLDYQMRIYKRHLAQKKFTVERATLDNILNNFPERADYILEKIKMFEETQ